MRRKCDKCEQEATVHEVTIKGGQKVEKHLCEACAREDGIAIQPTQPISELITKFVMSHSGSRAEGAKASTCAECGLTFVEFRQQGLLGCHACYGAFEEQLGSLIERAHEGATHHLGKTPKRAGGAIDRQKRIIALRKQLADAIDAEQYERAASLRDQLLSVEKDSELPDRARRGHGSEPTGSSAGATDGAESQA
jgi:protein arginine kinase activator